MNFKIKQLNLFSFKYSSAYKLNNIYLDVQTSYLNNKSHLNGWNYLNTSLCLININKIQTSI